MNTTLKYTLLAVLAVVALALVTKGCAAIPGEGRAVRAVENLGLTDVKVISRGYSWGVLGGCHEQDITKFTLTGRDARGNLRTIEVCAPIIGGYTVRN